MTVSANTTSAVTTTTTTSPTALIPLYYGI